MEPTTTRKPGKRERLTGEERRDQLLRSAEHTFAQRGYHQTSTRELAQANEVSEVMLYKHFGSKKALFIAVLRYFGSQFSRNFYQGVQQKMQEHPLVALIDLFVDYKTTAQADPDLQRLLALAYAEASDPDIARVVNLYQQSLRAFLHLILIQAQTEGYLAPQVNVETATWEYMSVLQMMQVNRLLSNNDAFTDEQLTDLGRHILHGLVAPSS